MSSILRGNDNLDSSNLATDTELSTALSGKANTIVANDSQIKTALNATGTAPIYACRAWVNFNGTGTVAIRASGNVSSITDNGTGDYTVNFTTAMPDADYSTVHGSGIYRVDNITRTQTTSSVNISSGDSTSARYDESLINCAIFR